MANEEKAGEDKFAYSDKMHDPPLLFLRKQIVNNADWQVFWLGLLLNTFPWRVTLQWYEDSTGEK